MNSIGTKLFLMTVLSSITICELRSQNVAINSSGTAANLSAILDLDGVTGFTGPNGYKGLLIPRMTSAQRTGIVTLPAAAQGLIVYQTDGVQGFYYNTSITTTPAWVYLSSTGTDWALTGNTGTTASTSAIGTPVNNNFIGTTDAKDFVLASNNLERMRFASGGNIGIGVAPSTFTHINGAYTGTLGGLFASQGIFYKATSTNAVSNNNNHTGAQFQGQASSISKVKNLYGVEGDAFMGSTTATGLSTGQVVGVYGTASAISGSASTNVGEVYGVLGMPQFFDPLNATNTAGVAGELLMFAGTQTNASLFRGICNAGDISAGTITNLYGINIPVLSKTGGTVTNAYGAWIDNPTAGTNNYGAYFGGNVGIGVTTPAKALDIYSKFQVDNNGNIVKLNNVTTNFPAANAVGVLTNDGAGNLSWAAAAGGTSWNILGNAGTVDGTNFIGTTDNIPFNIRVNNQKAGRIDNTLFNSFFGYQAGNLITTGTANTGIGSLALSVNTTGAQNTAIGVSALFSNTTGNQNTAIGMNTVFSNTTGIQNTATGFQALNHNTTGGQNTATGMNALFANTTGISNTASGTQALIANTIGSANTAIGVQSLFANTSGGNNTAVGVSSLHANTTGLDNTAVGIQTLNANTTGFDNTAVGVQTLFTNTTGSENAAIGLQALYSNTIGIDNTASGDYALYTNSTGSENTANGFEALNFNTTGTNNSASGNYALYSNTTGSNNTALGYQAGYTATAANANTTGSSNVFIGYNSGPGVASASSLQNAIAIGKNALVSASNSMVLGGTGADAVNVGIGTTTPAKALDVYSKFQVDNNGNIVKLNNVTTNFPAANAIGVLTNDGVGNLSWAAAAAASTTCWSLLGNTGTTASTSAIGTAANNNFIGTTDAKDFVLISSGLERMRISSTGGIGVGTTAPTASTLMTINPTTNALKNGIDMTLAGATSAATGLSITTGNLNVNGITVTHSSASITSSLYGIGAVLSSTNIVSGYNAYRNGSGLSYGIYGINGTNGAYATNASTWAAFLQGRTVISSESSPTSPLGTDLEVRNTTTGAAAPATVSLRQTNALTTSGNILTNLNFGDNNVTGAQAQIQTIRGAASSGAGDLPTDMIFYTTPDASAVLTERMRIANTGNVGIGAAIPAQALDVFSKFQVSSTGDIVKINNVTTTWPAANAAGVLTNNGAGVLTWAAAGAGSGWGLTGNAGTDGGATNFIGTTDAKALSIRVGGVGVTFKSGLIDPAAGGSTFFGYQSGKGVFPSDNISCTGMGYQALAAVSAAVSGTHNSAFGRMALTATTDGTANTAIGSLSMQQNVHGIQNTAVGVNSLNFSAGDGSTTGIGNTAIGYQTVYFNTTGNYNTALGYEAYTSGNFTNSMVLGADPTGVINPTASNMVNIGDHSITSIKGQVAFTVYSDGRVKDNVQENVPGLTFIKELRPVTYNYNYNKELELSGGKKTADWEGKYDIEKIKFSGFIAQEVEAAAKKVGYNFSGVDKPANGKGLYGLRYSDFVVPLVKSVQELSNENEDLKAKVESLSEDNKEIKAELAKIRSMLETNKKQ